MIVEDHLVRWSLVVVAVCHARGCLGHRHCLAEQDGPVAQGPEADLRQVWAQITDPRDRRGRRHSLVVILALMQAAVVAGATSFAAIRHWIGAALHQVFADIGSRQSRWTGEYQAPHPDTVCRVLQRVDPAEVDATYARYRAAQTPMQGHGLRLA